MAKLEEILKETNKCQYCPEKNPANLFKHFGISHCAKNSCAQKLYRDNDRKRKTPYAIQ